MKKLSIYFVNTPFGTLSVAHSESTLLCIQLPQRDGKADIQSINTSLGKRFPETDIVQDNINLPALDNFIENYFIAPEKTGQYRGKLDTGGRRFQQRVWQELMDIPAGEIATYGEIAKKVGSPKASRAVGAACAANPIPIIIPCHRVIGGNGSLTGFGGGLDMKKKLLEMENALNPRLKI